MGPVWYGFIMSSGKDRIKLYTFVLYHYGENIINTFEFKILKYFNGSSNTANEIIIPLLVIFVLCTG